MDNYFSIYFGKKPIPVNTWNLIAATQSQWNGWAVATALIDRVSILCSEEKYQ